MAENFVFVLHPDELASHIGRWKEKVFLAVHFNSEDDESSFLLFREEEFQSALEKFAKDLPVIPEYEGFNSGKISFGTESKIIRMIQEQETLPEFAEDYSVNFDFESENAHVDNAQLVSSEYLNDVPEDIETVTIEHQMLEGNVGAEDSPEDHHSNDETKTEPNQKEFNIENVGVDLTGGIKYYSNTSLKMNVFKIRKRKNKVELNLNGSDILLNLNDAALKYSLDGRSIMIPYSNTDMGDKQVINLTEVPVLFKSDLTYNWQDMVYEVTDNGVVAYKNNQGLNANFANQKIWMFSTIFLAFMSFVGFVSSYSTFHSVEKLASEALSIAETVSEKATLKVDMNPVYLNELRNALLSQEEPFNEE